MCPASRPTLARRLIRIGRHHVAPESWNLLLRACAGSALLALIVALVFPAVSDLAAFFTLMLIACGPTSAFLPAASEPLLIAFGRVYPPLLIAGIGIVAVVLVEFMNYSVFDAVLNSEKLATMRNTGVARLTTRWFRLQPFGTVAVAALSPIPFWIARTCAVLSRYSVPRYMCATALGRFVRLLAISALGSALPISIGSVCGTALALIVLFGIAALLGRHRQRRVVVPA
jgi:uncharacterized membrane protein YdjX (TVP38/TMEM64 family)